MSLAIDRKPFVDDPDGNMVESYSCKSERNDAQYCNADVDSLLGGAITRTGQGKA